MIYAGYKGCYFLLFPWLKSNKYVLEMLTTILTFILIFFPSSSSKYTQYIHNIYKLKKEQGYLLVINNMNACDHTDSKNEQVKTEQAPYWLQKWTGENRASTVRINKETKKKLFARSCLNTKADSLFSLVLFGLWRLQITIYWSIKHNLYICILTQKCIQHSRPKTIMLLEW